MKRLSISLLVALAVAGVAGSDLRLIEAVKAGNRDAIRALVAQPVEVNAAEADGATALHWAAHADDVETVHLLLRAGASANAASRTGVTPLSLAALNGGAAVIDALLKAGADPNASLPGDQTILMTASRTGNAEAVKLLLDRGAAVNAREAMAGESAMIWAAAENHAGVIKVLAAYGGDVNGRSSRQRFSRDRFGDGIVALQTILPKGYWTPLMYAARQNGVDAARALAEAGADLNLADSEGTTAMIVAINNYHFDVAALLVEKGADLDIADAAGMTALYAAVEVNTLGATAGRPALKASGRFDAVDLVKLLLTRGAHPDSRLKSGLLPKLHMANAALGEGSTPLMRAARSLDLPIMRALLDGGANATLTNKNQVNALMLATSAAGGRPSAAQDRIEALTLCLDKGVDINAVNDTGQTALHMAVQTGDAGVRFLAEHGATLDIKDKQGRTPLDVALGVGGGGRGAAPVVRESTAALLRQLMGAKATAAAVQ